MTHYDWQDEVAVVGAGAAGLWAAAVRARRGASVRLFEKMSRSGTKILASGGTRCNLTTTLDGPAAARLFRRAGERFLRPAFAALPPAAVRERFDALGVPTVTAPLEKVFPKSQRARDVRDALDRDARAAGVNIELDAGILGIEPVAGTWPSGGGWALRVAGDRSAHCRELMLCPGGASYPLSGTTGDGYAWLRELDLPVVEPVPALAPLSSPAGWVKALTGIAWQDGEVRLELDGRVVARRRRPVAFTHAGLSGPAAMDVSVHVARAAQDSGAEDMLVLIDLFPDVSREALRELLIAGARTPGSPSLARVLPEPIPRKFLESIAGAAGLSDGSPTLMSLSKDARHRWIETLKGLPVPIDGTLGYDKAEVTAGGLSLAAVDPRTMRVNGRPGLYVFGELLDLDGPIGGLNFQAAFACAPNSQD